MCGRYTLIDPGAIASRFGVENVLEQMHPRYNVALGQGMPVIVRDDTDHKDRVEIMRWGLVPPWAKDIKIGYKMINARAETVAEKPSFRNAFKRRRCLVPTTGFYEWKKEADGKVPYFIRLKDGGTFAFAGLYEHWQDAEGIELNSYTIITTQANSLMELIHDRMPVILRNEEADEWLAKDVVEPDQITRLLVPYDANSMEAYSVSAAVNVPTNDFPDLIKLEIDYSNS